MTTSFTGPLDLTHAKFAKLRPISQSAVTLRDGLLLERQLTSRRVGLRHGYKMLEKAGNFENLKWAAGKTSGPYRGPFFMDSDLYKWVEGVALELANGSDAELSGLMDSVIELIAAAQTPEGYLNSFYQMAEPQNRWKNIAHGHELYCAGHLFQAAVAHFRTTDSKSLLNVATKFADHIDDLVKVGTIDVPCGHPEIETALVELARATGEKRYLALSEYFLNRRGYDLLSKDRGQYQNATYLGLYLQDHVPVRDAKEVVGHSVRQLYLTAGMADVYLETGEKALLDAQLRQWRDMTTRKMFITGGVGSKPSHEAFGDAYELPNSNCYCETCAQIASVFWNWRLLMITGESQFADVIERTIFNGFLSGVSMDGTRFFYVNPLSSNGGVERPEWHGCACCPPNVMRLLASIGQYVATTGERGVQVHQFAACEMVIGLPGGGNVKLKMDTEYPWKSVVDLTVVSVEGKGTWELAVRVPAWAENASYTVNEKPALPIEELGYARFSRAWAAGDRLRIELHMEPRLTVAHPHVDSTVGRVAIEHGPLVFCVEQPDNDEALQDLRLDGGAPLNVVWREDLLGGTLMVEANALVVDKEAWSGMLYSRAEVMPLPTGVTTLKAIPYFLWANRGGNAMRVWLPVARGT